MDYTERLFAYDNLFYNGQMKIPVGEIFQVSELSVIRSGEIFSHTQHCDEITYAISGSAVFTSGESESILSEGQIHFVRQGVLHKIKADENENFRYLCIGFNPDFCSSAVKAFYAVLGSRPHIIISDNGTVKNLSEFLIREFYNWDENSADMINMYLSEILIIMSRLLCGKTSVSHSSDHEKSSYYAMYKALRYIDREYLQLKNVKSIAAALSYSEYYLSHLFKEKMGITIKEYLTKKKIAYAADILKSSDLSVEKISEILNFSSAHSFRRAFKQYLSLTPTEYRNKPDSNFCTIE